MAVGVIACYRGEAIWGGGRCAVVGGVGNRGLAMARKSVRKSAPKAAKRAVEPYEHTQSERVNNPPVGLGVGGE